MPTIPIVHLTDTTLQVVDFDRFLTEKPAYEALMGWLKAHGIDPDTVPSDGIIEVFPETRIIHHGYRAKGSASTETMQVVRAHPIAPWPPEVVALAKTYGGRDDELESVRDDLEEARATIRQMYELKQFAHRGEPGAPDSRILQATATALGVDVGDLIAWIPTAASR